MLALEVDGVCTPARGMPVALGGGFVVFFVALGLGLSLAIFLFCLTDLGILGVGLFLFLLPGVCFGVEVAMKDPPCVSPTGVLTTVSVATRSTRSGVLGNPAAGTGYFSGDDGDDGVVLTDAGTPFSSIRSLLFFFPIPLFFFFVLFQALARNTTQQRRLRDRQILLRDDPMIR